jgi:ABC-2 type transport system ATP-binding protein
VLGRDPADRDQDLRARMGIVLQSSGIYQYLTVRESVAHWAGFYPRPRDVEEVISIVGLEAAAEQRANKLSGGQQRRLDLALGIVGAPEVLFLDEPTTGFDPEARREAWRVIGGLREGGTTIVLTTHYLDEVEALADRLAILREGRIVTSGTPAEVVGKQPTRVRFRVDPGAAAALAHLHPTITIDGQHVELHTDDPTSTVHALTSWALANGHQLVDLQVGRPRLEDVYLALLEPGRA